LAAGGKATTKANTEILSLRLRMTRGEEVGMGRREEVRLLSLEGGVPGELGDM